MKLNSFLNSKRSGHLTAAAIIAIGVAVGDLLTGALVFAWEWFATPDMDLAENRRPKRIVSRLWVLFWLPWAHMVSHRSRASHSLIGTILRLGYVGIPLALMLTPSGILGFWWQSNPDMVLDVASRLVAAALIADTTHLIKDGYKLNQLLLGK